MPEELDNGTIPDGQESPESGADQTQTTTTEVQSTEQQAPTNAVSDNSGVSDTLGKSIKHFTDENKSLKATLQDYEARLAEYERSQQTTSYEEPENPSNLPTDEYGNVWFNGEFRDPEYVALQQKLEAQDQAIQELRGMDSQREQARQEAEIQAQQRAIAEDLGQKLVSERATALPFLEASETPLIDQLIAQQASIMAQADIDAGKEFSAELVQGHIRSTLAQVKAIFGKAGNAQIESNLKTKGLPSNDGQVVLEGQKSYNEMTPSERAEFNERRAANILQGR